MAGRGEIEEISYLIFEKNKIKWIQLIHRICMVHSFHYDWNIYYIVVIMHQEPLFSEEDNGKPDLLGP